MRVALFVAMVAVVSTASYAQPAQPARSDGGDRATSDLSPAEQLRVLREEVEAQQKWIVEQQRRIDELARQLQAPEPFKTLGEVARTVPTLPAPGVVSGPTDFAQAPAPAAPPQPQPSKTDGPAAQDSIALANGKLRIGTVVYGDWAYYPKTGFGPQFTTQTNFPGPGNDNFSSFDITRTYLNFIFSPNDRITFRLTPNMYRQAGVAAADKLGQVGAIGSTVDGNLSVRIKYAYLEIGKLFDSSPTFRGARLRLGSQTNPLIDWEEALYDYRFVNLVPWNYLSLSSTHVGASLLGVVSSSGKQRLDYEVGVFNDANFHQFEQSSQKQAMARVSFYPLGATSRFQGFGVTGFVDQGFTNVAPDIGAADVSRVAVLAHYTSAHNGASLAGEYDYGRNAFGTGNMFSGSAPQDLFGVGTTPFANMTKLAQAILGGTASRQRGFDAFGHVNVPNSKLAVFGMYEFFQPNTNVTMNPLDFHRLVAGVAYRYSPRLRFAIDSQNVLYRYAQFVFPSAALGGLSPSLAAANPNGIPNAVPADTKAIFFNFEFTF